MLGKHERNVVQYMESVNSNSARNKESRFMSNATVVVVVIGIIMLTIIRMSGGV